MTEIQDEYNTSTGRPNKFRKRKNKFLANAKGFGKHGNFGRGTQLEDEEWSYYINIMDTIKQGFDTMDDKITMANNVFEQTASKEIHVSSNQVACAVIEHLLPYTSEENFGRYQNAFANDFRPICSDKFASHVLQKIVEISFLRAVSKLQPPTTTTTPATNEDGSAAATTIVSRKRKHNEIVNEKEYNLSMFECSAQHRQQCTSIVERTSKFLLNNLEDFVWDQYASHVIRTCFRSLSGRFAFKAKDQISEENNKPKNGKPNDKECILVVPDEWIEILREYAVRLQAWPQFPEFPENELSSALLQNLCLALRYTDKKALKSLGKRIVLHVSTIVDPENKDSLPKIFTNECSIRLLEALLESAGSHLFSEIYSTLFKGRLAKLSEMKSANFAVQKLLDNIKDKEEFEEIFDELAPNMENLLKIGYTGVINAICQACLRLCARQGAFVQSLQTALHCPVQNNNATDKTDYIIATILKLKSFDENEKSTFIHLHGSLILQSLLHFNKPIKFVQSILDTDPNDLCELFQNAKGSHVVDAFLQSKMIGEKSREKLIRHMDGQYLSMAISRSGSRAVESFFAASGDQQKSRICRELSRSMNMLNSTPSGRLINYKLRVETFRMNPTQWKATFNKENKVQNLFKDILE